MLAMISVAQLADFLSDHGMPLVVANITREHVEEWLGEVAQYKPTYVSGSTPANETNKRTNSPEFSAWSEALADAWIAVTLERVGRLNDELAPDCPLDGDGWERHEAAVAAAYALKNRRALEDALFVYEEFAHTAFDAWRTKQLDAAAHVRSM